MGWHACSVISGKVVEQHDLGTHTLFIAEVTDAKMLNANEPLTYAELSESCKTEEKKRYPKTRRLLAGDAKSAIMYMKAVSLPADYTCPLCGHDASDFEPIYEG